MKRFMISLLAVSTLTILGACGAQSAKTTTSQSSSSSSQEVVDKTKEVERAVAQSETSLATDDYTSASKLVQGVDDEKKRTAFEQRLAKVKVRMEAKDLTNQLESNQTEENRQLAQAAVDKLDQGDERNSLQNRVQAVQTAILAKQAAAEAEAQRQAQEQAAQAEAQRVAQEQAAQAQAATEVQATQAAAQQAAQTQYQAPAQTQSGLGATGPTTPQDNYQQFLDEFAQKYGEKFDGPESHFSENY